MTNRIRVRPGALVVLALIALLASTAPAAAKSKPISGKLSKRGYDVIALAASGQAKTVRAKRGKFKLRPPANIVTLHLRAPDGTYAGPIVVGGDPGGKGKNTGRKSRKGKKKGKRRVIVGVRAGAELGKVKVRAGKGFAKASGLDDGSIDAKRKARAKKGVPIGAGNFGRVSVSKLKGPSSDRDLDGIPTSLDIDDDGDLILDTVDPSTTARAAQEPPPPPLSLLPLLSLPLDQTANANHPALAGQIDTALSREGKLILGASATTELDCAGDPAAAPPRPGLVYCSRGGTGRLFTPTIPYSGSPRFPECCDPDNDGFGTVPPFMGPAQLWHGATSAQIKTGDVLVARLNDAGGGVFTQTLPYVFATVPALVSYHDSAVPPNQVTLSYPYPPGVAHEFPVAAGPDGNVVVTLTFWRPQRKPIGDGPNREACLDDTPPCQWVDLGGLVYGAGLGAGECPQSVLSETDPNLTVRPPGDFGVADGFRDSRPDQPANPNQTLTFTLNITQCLEGQGQGSSLDDPGEVRPFFLIAGGGGRADQTMSFKRE